MPPELAQVCSLSEAGEKVDISLNPCGDLFLAKSSAAVAVDCMMLERHISR